MEDHRVVQSVYC